MFVIEDVRTSRDTTKEITALVRASIGEAYIALDTNSGTLEVQFEGFASEFMAIGKTREGLHVAVLLAKDEASHDTARSTIILSKQLANA